MLHILFMIMAALSFTTPTQVYTSDLLTTQQEDSIKSDYNAMNNRLKSAESSSQALEIMKEFLLLHPETEYSIPLLNSVSGITQRPGFRPEDHVGFFIEIEKKVVNPEIATWLDKEICFQYSRIGDADQVRMYAATLLTSGNITFNQIVTTMQSCERVGVWAEIEKLIKIAESHATVESVRNENPGRPLDEEQLTARVANRMSYIRLFEAWVLANSGQCAKALALFAEAEKMNRSRNFFGYCYYADFYIFHGKTLMMQEDYEGAMQQFVTVALGPDIERGRSLMRDAYIAANGNDSGFERKELELRRRFGKRIQDFQAMNYEGESRLFSSLLGTYSVLQFWRSTCSSCHEFMIDFKDDYARLKQLGLAFISYSIGPDRDRDLAFIRDNGLEYSFITIGFEEDPRTYTDRYDIYATPITYVLDADATVIYLFFGYRDGYVSKLLVECLEELLSD